jgi:hypothetical protein
MDFKTQAKISVISAITTGVIGVTMAYTGFGVWSIVWPGVFGGAVRCGLLWIWGKWRPTWEYSWASFKELFGFGSKLLASGLIDTIINNIYPIIIVIITKIKLRCISLLTATRNHRNKMWLKELKRKLHLLNFLMEIQILEIIIIDLIVVLEKIVKQNISAVIIKELIII